jgi:hypothetical protein
MHSRSIGIEDSRYLNPEPVLSVVVEEQGLGAAFPLIIAGTQSYRIDMSPVVFRLRVNFGISIDL